MAAIEGLSPNPTREELEEELDFTRVLLASLNPDHFDYEELMQRHAAKIDAIERLLDLGSQSRQASQEDGFLNEPATTVNLNTTRTANASSFRSITPPSRRPAQSYKIESGSRKRLADALGSSPPLSSSKRATPSPSESAPHTPGSEGLPDCIFLDFTQASSSRPQQSTAARVTSAAYRDQQLKLERAAALRREQLDRDNQIANALSNGMPLPRPLPSQTTTQAVLNRDGSFRRVSSLNGGKAIKAEPGSSAAGPFLSREHTFRGMSPPVNHRPIKAEFTSSSTPVSFGSVANGRNGAFAVKTEGSTSFGSSAMAPFVPKDNKPRSALQIDSDSDIEEIDRNSFEDSAQRRTSNRASQLTAAPMHSYLPGQRALNPNPNLLSATQPMGYGWQSHLQPSSMTGPQAYDQARVSLSRPPAGFDLGMSQSQAYPFPQPTNGYAIPGAFPGTSSFCGPIPSPHFSVRPNITRPFQQRASQYNPHSTVSRIPPEVVDLLDDSGDDGDDYGQYSYLRNLPANPEQNQAELDELLKSVAKGADLPEAMLQGTPNAMKMPLMPHQKVGLTWMLDREKSENGPKGGILADDMGLGKTIQALALMVSNPSTDRARKTTLIVAPNALMFQWELEIKAKIKSTHALKVHIHHGQKKKPWTFLRQFDVVLTTFGSLTADHKKLKHWQLVVANNPNAVPSKKEQVSLLGADCLWYRVILDEAQGIKNKDTGAAQAAFKLRSVYRWCMTGTPMMNNVGELWPLIHFCRLRPYNDIKRFRDEIKNPLDKRFEDGRQAAMRKLQALIRGIMLRRMKDTKIDGKPIITLPPRTSNVVTGKFSKEQQEFYKTVELKAAMTFNKYLKEGSVMRNYSHVLTLLLRLRQITDHPILATEIVNESGVETAEKEMLAMAKKLSPDVVRRLLEMGEDFECPVCFDAIAAPGPIFFFPCGHFLDRECLGSLAMSAQSNMEPEIKCPECRSKFKPQNVIDYATYKKVHRPDLISAEEAAQDEDDADDESDSDSDDGSDDGDSLKDFIVDEDIEDDDAEPIKAEEAEASGEVEEDSEGDDPVPQVASSAVRRGPTGKKGKGKGKGKAKKEKTRKTLAELRSEGRRNKKSWAKYIRRFEKNWETSAKIDQTFELLDQIEVEKPREKILIFSQFTSFLDFIEVPLRRRGTTYERYDGSMSMNDRQEAVKSFTTKPQVKIMLVSLKAGNAGLNLNCASQVIILDPFWNPFTEEQAIDRAHRIGQQHEVNVHRIVIPDTVEDRILQLQEKKRDLINTALDENASKSLSRLGVGELRYLFGVDRTLPT